MTERHPPLRALTSRKSPSGIRPRARRKVGAGCAVEAIAIETYGVISSGEPEGC
jgi:hypothetical protein